MHLWKFIKLGAWAIIALAAANSGPHAAASGGAQHVLATVGSGVITVSDFRAWLSDHPADVAQHYTSSENKAQLLDKMIASHLLEHRAERHTPELRWEGQNAVEEQMVAELVRQKVHPRATTPGDEEVESFLKQTPPYLKRGPFLRASHILVATRAEAEAIQKQASSGDLAEFQKLARAHSLDRETRMRGGDLRYFNRGGLAADGGPPVEGAVAREAFKLGTLGAVSAPVSLGPYFSVVKVTGRRDFTKEEEALWRQRVQEQLLEQARRDALDTYLRALRRRYKPEVHPESLKQLVVPPS